MRDRFFERASWRFGVGSDGSVTNRISAPSTRLRSRRDDRGPIRPSIDAPRRRRVDIGRRASRPLTHSGRWPWLARGLRITTAVVLPPSVGVVLDGRVRQAPTAGCAPAARRARPGGPPPTDLRGRRRAAWPSVRRGLVPDADVMDHPVAVLGQSRDVDRETSDWSTERAARVARRGRPVLPG